MKWIITQRTFISNMYEPLKSKSIFQPLSLVINHEPKVSANSNSNTPCCQMRVRPAHLANSNNSVLPNVCSSHPFNQLNKKLKQ